MTVNDIQVKQPSLHSCYLHTLYTFIELLPIAKILFHVIRTTDDAVDLHGRQTSENIGRICVEENNIAGRADQLHGITMQWI